VADITVIGDAEKLLREKTENYSKNKFSTEVLGGIEFKNVNFSYEKKLNNDKEVFKLKDLNLKIDMGQMVAFVGESGGGKTTAIDLIGGFYLPKKGQVLVDEIATKD
jgi:ABC-type multidrug transport system fused ATPase/permease subunit